VNHTVPSLFTTTSFGEFRARPPQESTSTSISPVAVESRLIRAGSAIEPCSQITRRPSRSSVMPLAALAGSRTTVTRPLARSRRLIATVGLGTDVK